MTYRLMEPNRESKIDLHMYGWLILKKKNKAGITWYPDEKKDPPHSIYKKLTLTDVKI